MPAVLTVRRGRLALLCGITIPLLLLVLPSADSPAGASRQCLCGGEVSERQDSRDSRNVLMADALIAERLRYRRQRIRTGCDLHGGTDTGKWRLLEFRIRDIVWTKIPKAASTYITALMLRKAFNNATYNCGSAYACFTELERYRAQQQETVKGQDFTVGREGRAGESATLLVVRNPLKRLVSAYIDKVAGYDHMRIWSHIHRVVSSSNKSASERGQTRSHVTPGSSAPSPTFSDFVDFIIWQNENLTSIDAHWESQEVISDVCNTDYILQSETLGEEMPYVARQLGMEEVLKEPVTTANERRREYDPVEMLEALTDQQRDRLDSIYRMDIVLFNS